MENTTEESLLLSPNVVLLDFLRDGPLQTITVVITARRMFERYETFNIDYWAWNLQTTK
jgi:hypothetical protein